MALIYQDGKPADPSELAEGTRYDPARGPGFWVNQEGQPKNLFVGVSSGDVIEVRDGRWTRVGGEREK
jgi:hypothetical protein